MYYGMKSEIHPVVTGCQVAWHVQVSGGYKEWGMGKGVPLKVSPLLSSTSMGEPCAAVNSERGSCSLVAGDGERAVPLCLFELWMTKM